jgi:GNAT superfamily N-acetyltransferase
MPDDRLAVIELGSQYRQVGKGPPSYLDNQVGRLLLALDRDLLVGIACVSHRRERHAATIDQVFVRPSYRRWGIATQLVGLAITYAEEQDVHTLLAEAPVTNPVLLVYLKAGFRVSGFIDTHYPPGGDGPTTALFLAYDLG